MSRSPSQTVAALLKLADQVAEDSGTGKVMRTLRKFHDEAVRVVPAIRDLVADHERLRALARRAMPLNWEDDPDTTALGHALGLKPGEEP